MARVTREVSAARAIEGIINRLNAARLKVAELEGELAEMQGKIQGAMPLHQTVSASPIPISLREMPADEVPGIPGEVNPADNPEEGRWL